MNRRLAAVTDPWHTATDPAGDLPESSRHEVSAWSEHENMRFIVLLTKQGGRLHQLDFLGTRKWYNFPILHCQSLSLNVVESKQAGQDWMWRLFPSLTGV